MGVKTMYIELKDLLNNDLSMYGEERVDVLNASKRLPIILLIDISYSMADYNILIKEVIEKIYTSILNDRILANAVELSVMTYNDKIEIFEKLREIKRHEDKGRNIDIKFECVSLMGLGLKAAIELLEFRKKIYVRSKPRIRYYTPLLFIVSDGIPACFDKTITETENAAMVYSLEYIKQNVSSNRLAVFSAVLGNSDDHSLMRQLTGLNDDRHILKMEHSEDIVLFIKLIKELVSGGHPVVHSLNDFSLKQ